MSNQPKKRVLSKAARARISAAQRERWAKWKAEGKHAKHATANGKVTIGLGDLIHGVDKAIKQTENKVAQLKQVRGIIVALDRVVA
jgi:hypothetical protein